MITTHHLQSSIEKYALPFQRMDDLNPLIQRASKAKFVLLGEASHGTSEYYTTRTEITKQLIEKFDFSFIAVEGDWPSCYEVNHYIKGYTSEYKDAKEVLKAFHRWPSWMWANEEVLELVEWLRAYNQRSKKKVGFYGLDVYSLWESMEAIVQHLRNIQSPYLDKAIRAFECFEPFSRRGEQYGVSAVFYGKDCMDEVIDLLNAIQWDRNMYKDDEADLNLLVNALVTTNAEHYYHTMITDDNESWNIRDRHMVEVLGLVADFYGKEAKGVVWEHNTHIGDARFTDMATEGLVNVGQLTREKYERENIYAVGFGAYKGTVIAATKWGEPYKVMPVLEAVSDSWEYYLHLAGSENKILLFDEQNKEEFQPAIGHRAIGVVYHPHLEHLGNYVPSQISDRYDAFIYFDDSHALRPLFVESKMV
ncbi:erythromycin esterase family protein [Anoxybacteroides tepidamans]|uniref:erythromycin esterase family protein n=1 Tax=Anoxybacteroides tepidamans TaxID=265948 RepID=UPI000489BE80|nr:erythromycin esterase family protein [Anoxybacillus tepidamans]